MDSKKSVRFAGGLLLIAALMAAIAVLPPTTGDGALLEAIFDAGHVPMFFVFAWVVLWLSRSTLSGKGGSHYLVAAVLVVLAGLGTEFLQKFGARDAGWIDFGRDLLGGGAGLLSAWALGPRKWPARVGAMIVALALVGFGFAELIRVKFDLDDRDASFPSIAGFDAPWEHRFVHGHDSDLDLVQAPAAWGAGTVGRVTFSTEAYPSLAVHEPFPDWSGYSALEFAVWAEEPAALTVRVHDTDHDQTYSDRFNREIRIQPGLNQVRIALAEIEAAPRDRSLNLREVAGIAVFADHPAEPFTVWFDDLSLTVE
jgi:hypothetical protein